MSLLPNAQCLSNTVTDWVKIDFFLDNFHLHFKTNLNSKFLQVLYSIKNYFNYVLMLDFFFSVMDACTATRRHNHWHAESIRLASTIRIYPYQSSWSRNPTRNRSSPVGLQSRGSNIQHIHLFLRWRYLSKVHQ